MDKINIKLLKTAKNYAAALFEIAEKQDATKKVQKDIDLITKTISENANLEKFLNNPVIKSEDKKSAITEIFSKKVQKMSLNFLLLLADNSRYDAIFDIQREFKELIDNSRNVVLVKAISAVEIKRKLKTKLKAKIEKLLNKTAEIQYEINPEILGGLIIEAEGKTIDNSVITQIKNIKKQLT